MFKAFPHNLRAALAVLFIAASLGQAPSARADVLMDQLISPDALTSQDAWSSQVFSDYPSYSIAAVDDFTTTQVFEITNVQVALLGYSDFTSYSNVTGYEVNLYSSLAAANRSLTGDVGHVFIDPAGAAVTTPYTGEADSALVSLPVNIRLPGTGTFYVSVLADLSLDTGGQVGVYGTQFYPGANPGGQNSYLENPGGGFALAGNQIGLGEDLAYRVTGTAVPEPSTLALAGLGLAGGALLMVRRRLAV